MSDAPATPVTIEKRDNAVIARAQKKLLDDDELKTLTQLVDKAASDETGTSLVVLDLSPVRIVPSLALGLLVQMSQRCRARQQRLKLAGVQPQVRQVFSVTRLDRLFEFAETVEAALE
jgi:anti-anti-sigma factor